MGFAAIGKTSGIACSSAVGWKCERCGTETGALEAHHVHYDTVGFEELSDLRALCPSCHKATPPPRQRRLNPSHPERITP